MKQIKYRGYIYWILMILGIFVGNLFDKVEKGMILCILFIVGFEICGDAISQLIMWTTLGYAEKLVEVKAKRNFLFLFMAMITGFFPFPTFVEGLRRDTPVISMIEIPLFILLLLNQLRWVNYQVKEWQIKHNVNV